MNPKKIAQRLIELRMKKGVSRETAAKAFGISVSALTMYELGERTPRDETKISIAEYYGTTVGALFFEH